MSEESPGAELARTSRADEISAILAAVSAGLRRTSLRLGLPIQDHEDLLQETLVRLLRSRNSIVDPVAWLRVAFRNEVFRHYTRSKQFRLVNLEESHLARSPAPGDNQSMTLELSRGLCRIKPRSRQVLLLRYRYGFTLAEIAALLGYARASMKRILNRAIHDLKRELAATSSAR